MNKNLKNLTFALFLVGFSAPLYASAWTWKAWKNEDEELNFSGKSKNEIRPTSSKSGFSWWKNEDEELNFRDKSQTADSEIDSKIETLPEIGPEKSKKYSSNSKFSYQKKNADIYSDNYDTVQIDPDVKNIEVYNSVNKWKNGRVSVFWENYRGNNVRIEMLRNNKDLKEMRLKFVQSPNMISDPDASISDMLNVVANQVMKRTCGRKAKQSIILYERPSVELEKETAADNYKVMAKGTSLKEYGFRCIY